MRGGGPGEVDQAVAEGVVAACVAQASFGGRGPAGGRAQGEVGHRYRAARPCPAAVARGDCLAVSTEVTFEVHAEVGKDPVRMAKAMKLAIEAGRQAYLAGRMPRRLGADPSSPLTGLIR